MSTVAVLGAGAGGAAAVAELSQRGHSIRLWNRSSETLRPYRSIGGVRYDGVLGTGIAIPKLISADLAEVVNGADVILICLPTFSHAPIARELARIRCILPVVLNPGHTGGALEFRQAYAAIHAQLPPIAEFSTLTYVARKYEADKTSVTGKANSVRVAALPNGQAALEYARQLYPGASVVSDVLASDLANVNMVLHCPGAVLGAAWVEATSGDFTFYVQGMTSGVARVMSQLDAERRSVAAAFGHDLPSLVEEMQAIGTIPKSWSDPHDIAGAVSSGEANRRIKAPDSFEHRYYLEDFGHGLLPFLQFAQVADVKTPVAQSLYELATAATGTDFAATGRTAARMGFDVNSFDSLTRIVRG
ncbi:NAD/NADP octopine/nopaline dehydrogenase family protein [Variovorax saccharolyticus]|uniref:NAD/NADP octopine/nopaline dehydrogenase family protein n=1 Tax=Variovorax saccharolyticus TaxID=3053516 RepID=UPI0025750F89|nr:NAD/NADP-dependent octopine/nopaline dehydrogenase family protein [Variovorax sp. J31P216]MDM0029939.1 NAD/NADP octopine/nopaline dehydrogenase family protein [Variovorax sp. J31P216]